MKVECELDCLIPGVLFHADAKSIIHFVYGVIFGESL